MGMSVSRKWFAWAMPRLARHYDALLADRKRDLLRDLAGTVLEIGPGSGVNFRYYPRAIHLVGFEPNEYLHPTLQRSSREADLRIDLRCGAAEHLDFADRTADAVVTTAVLCSVADQIQVLREIKRVLKPGGRLVFVEHIAANRGTRLRTVQRIVRPLWRCLADGCDPVRETDELMVKEGFKLIRLERFHLPLGPVAPHIAGVAIVQMTN